MSADRHNGPPETKLTRTKRRWAEEGRFLTGRTARPESERLPPGQHLVRDWPVLDLGEQPEIARDDWRLTVDGTVEHPAMWTWETFLSQPQTESVSDIHCVTTWSRYDNRWTGVATRDLLDAVAPKPEARFVMLHSYDEYTTNLTLEDFASADGRAAGPQLGGHAADPRARRPSAAHRSASLLLEKREMAAADRVQSPRRARPVGGQWLP